MSRLFPRPQAAHQFARPGPHSRYSKEIPEFSSLFETQKQREFSVPQRGQAVLSPEAPAGRRFEVESQNLSVEKQEKLLISVLF